MARCASTARRAHFDGSREAEAAGIVLIHQEFNLAEDLTIAQNIFLGHEKRRGWPARRRRDACRRDAACWRRSGLHSAIPTRRCAN